MSDRNEQLPRCRYCEEPNRDPCPACGGCLDCCDADGHCRGCGNSVRMCFCEGGPVLTGEAYEALKRGVSRSVAPAD